MDDAGEGRRELGCVWSVEFLERDCHGEKGDWEKRR